MPFAESAWRLPTQSVPENARSVLRSTIARAGGSFGRSILASAAAIVLVLAAAQRAPAQFDTVVETGPSSNRVDAFFLGDGYTASDISAGTYSTHVQNYIDYIFSNSTNTDPYSRYQNFFNVYRVNVVSNESGADIPQNGIVKDTALDATYQFDGVTDRLLYVSESKAILTLISAVSGSGKNTEARFVTVNESVYGGGGGNLAVYAGGNSSALELALHESGHSFDSLADEYDYGGPANYMGPEPSQVNVTTDSSGAKWSHWLGYNDPTGGVVGAFEGAKASETGIYRPTVDSKMRTLGIPFNAISREKIILDIYNYVDPLDGYTPNNSTLIDPLALSAMPVDTNVIDTQWSIDGLYDATLDGLDTLEIASLGLSIGDHTIDLRAFDPTGFDPVNGWVRINTGQLEQFVSWDLLVTVPEPSPAALAFLALAGLAVWARCRRRRSPRPAGVG